MRAQLETIAKKLREGYTDSEIMHDLQLKRTAFYSYKSKIFKVFGDIAAKKTEQSLELEAELLKERYIRLFRTIELKISDGSITMPQVAGADTAAAVATNIFRLEAEGLRARQGRGLQRLEQQAVRYLGDLQPRLSEPDFTHDKEESDEDPKDPVEESTTRESEEAVF